MPSLRGSATTGTNTSATVSVSRPSGVVAGDILIALQCNETGLSGGLPSGWTQIYDDYFAFEARVAIRVAGTSEPSSYTFGGNTGGIRQNVIMIAVAEADPDLYTLTDGNSGSGSTITAPAATAVRGDAFVVRYAVASDGSPVTFTPPSGHTERAEIAQEWVSCTCATQNTLAAAGSVSSANFTASTSIVGSEFRLGITMLLYPPAAAEQRIVVSPTAVHRSWSW